MEIGDIVKLKSGGPEMTIEDIGKTTGKIMCHWAFRSQNGYFVPESLMLVRESAASTDDVQKAAERGFKS